MAIAKTVTDYLKQQRIDYDIVVHPLSEASSMETAEAAHVSGERVAKAVVLKDSRGHLLAVLPATHTLDLEAVRRITGRHLDLAPEGDLARLFPDCAVGAVPAIGPAYGMDTVVDNALLAQPELYFEAGDHRELIQVGESQFEQLMGVSTRGLFSRHVG